jgi:hypothetical protein
LTDGCADDARAALELIDMVDGDIESLTADPANDTLDIYDASAARGAEVVIHTSSPALQLQRTQSRMS